MHDVTPVKTGVRKTNVRFTLISLDPSVRRDDGKTYRYYTIRADYYETDNNYSALDGTRDNRLYDESLLY